MASIKLTELTKKVGNTVNNYTYTDLHFDIQQQEIGISNSRTIKSIKGKDILVDYDEEAIRNSIFNILNTRKMQRILLPQFGCNIIGYIGLPCTTTTGQQIGNEILQSIKTWEPRVIVDQVLVVSKPDDHEFDVTITVTIPYLKKSDVKLFGTITNNGSIQAILQ